MKQFAFAAFTLGLAVNPVHAEAEASLKGMGREVLFTNKTPLTWKKISFRRIPSADQGWLPIFLNTEAIEPGAKVRVTMPEEDRCAYLFLIEADYDDEPISAELNIDICQNPEPQIR